MTRNIKIAAAAFALTALSAWTLPSTAQADGPLKLVIIKEQGAGGGSQAQGFVDRLVARMATLSGASEAEGKYFGSRALALSYIKSSAPQFGIMSLPAFLALRKDHQLTVIGKAEVVSDGGRQYHVVSIDAKDLAGCKGSTLVSNHFEDGTFLEKVVADGAFVLADFTKIDAKRPVQVLKKVVDGEAKCALIDDAQLAAAGKLANGTIKSVWSSAKLPPMVVVAFPSAPAAQRKTFSAQLSKVCKDEGKSTCDEAGIRSLATASDSDYAAVVSKMP